MCKDRQGIDGARTAKRTYVLKHASISSGFDTSAVPLRGKLFGSRSGWTHPQFRSDKIYTATCWEKLHFEPGTQEKSAAIKRRTTNTNHQFRGVWSSLPLPVQNHPRLLWSQPSDLRSSTAEGLNWQKMENVIHRKPPMSEQYEASTKRTRCVARCVANRIMAQR